MEKTNFILTVVLISFVLTGVLSFIPVKISPALALMIELGLEDLTQEADSILRGEVTELKSEWNEQKNMIYTYITLRVKECIAGQYEEETVTIKQLGGEVDGIGMSVSDSAVFKKGEEVIVFLKHDRSQQASRLQGVDSGVMAEVVGQVQGKYTVAKDVVIDTQTGGIHKRTFATRTGTIVTRPGKEMPLAEFVGQIKRIKEEQQ